MVYPPINRFSIVKMTDWLKVRISSGAKLVPGRIPDMPNRVAGVTSLQGPGLDMETLFDTVAFRVDSRGAENNIGDAEAIAYDIDDVILNADDNFYIGDVDNRVWCNGAGRTGSSPAQLSQLPDSQSRFVFVCTYYLHVSTNVGQVN